MARYRRSERLYDDPRPATAARRGDAQATPSGVGDDPYGIPDPGPVVPPPPSWQWIDPTAPRPEAFSVPALNPTREQAWGATGMTPPPLDYASGKYSWDPDNGTWRNLGISPGFGMGAENWQRYQGNLQQQVMNQQVYQWLWPILQGQDPVGGMKQLIATLDPQSPAAQAFIQYAIPYAKQLLPQFASDWDAMYRGAEHTANWGTWMYDLLTGPYEGIRDVFGQLNWGDPNNMNFARQLMAELMQYSPEYGEQWQNLHKDFLGIGGGGDYENWLYNILAGGFPAVESLVSQLHQGIDQGTPVDFNFLDQLGNLLTAMYPEYTNEWEYMLRPQNFVSQPVAPPTSEPQPQPEPEPEPTQSLDGWPIYSQRHDENGNAWVLIENPSPNASVHGQTGELVWVPTSGFTYWDAPLNSWATYETPPTESPAQWDSPDYQGWSWYGLRNDTQNRPWMLYPHWAPNTPVLGQTGAALWLPYGWGPGTSGPTFPTGQTPMGTSASMLGLQSPDAGPAPLSTAPMGGGTMGGGLGPEYARIRGGVGRGLISPTAPPPAAGVSRMPAAPPAPRMPSAPTMPRRFVGAY